MNNREIYKILWDWMAEAIEYKDYDRVVLLALDLAIINRFHWLEN